MCIIAKKCCGCCSLETGVIILAVLSGINVLLNLIVRNYFGFVLQAAITAIFIYALCDTKNNKRRHVLYISFVIYAIILALAYSFATLFVGFVLSKNIDKELEKECELAAEGNTLLENDCFGAAKILLLFVAWLNLITTLVYGILISIVLHGWW